MKLYTVAVYNLGMCIKEGIPGPTYSMEIISSEESRVSFSEDSQF